MKNAMLWLGAVALISGCDYRYITIERGTAVNTGKDPKGVPLNIDVVLVSPKDLSGDNLDYNRDLLPGSKITSREWFAKKPTAKSWGDKNDRDHYRIPPKQIYSYTDAQHAYGVVAGEPIRGTVYNDRQLAVLKVPSPGDIHDAHSLI